MIPGRVTRFAEAFHDTVLGLRTGQTGRANAALASLTVLLQDLVARLTGESQAAAAAVVNRMLVAKEGADSVALADVIEHELPSCLAETEIPRDLLDAAALQGVPRADTILEDDRDTRDVVEFVLARVKQCRHPAALTVYYADWLIARDRWTTADALLQPSQGGAAVAEPAGAYLSALVEAHFGRFERAVERMDEAYRGSPALRDGHFRISKKVALSGDRPGALALVRRDASMQRLSGPHLISLVVDLATAGEYETAGQFVDSAYAQNPAARNGYAWIGWYKAHDGRWREALADMEKDVELDRITPGMLQNVSLPYAFLDEWAKAERCIVDAYAADPGLTDAFGRLGWWAYLHGRDAGYFAEMIERDRALDRLGTFSEQWHALLSTIRGDAQAAAAAVETLYSRSADARNLYSLIGWLQLLNGHVDAGCRLLDLDFARSRMTGAFYPTYAVALNTCGRTAEALTAWSRIALPTLPRRLLKIGFAQHPNATLDATHLQELLGRGAALAEIAAHSITPGWTRFAQTE